MDNVDENAIESEAIESENAEIASVSEETEKQTEESNQKEPEPEVVKIVSNQQKLYEHARKTWSKLSDECLAIIRSSIDLLRSCSSDVVKEVLDDRKVKFFFVQILTQKNLGRNLSCKRLYNISSRLSIQYSHGTLQHETSSRGP